MSIRLGELPLPAFAPVAGIAAAKTAAVAVNPRRNWRRSTEQPFGCSNVVFLSVIVIGPSPIEPGRAWPPKDYASSLQSQPLTSGPAPQSQQEGCQQPLFSSANRWERSLQL